MQENKLGEKNQLFESTASSLIHHATFKPDLNLTAQRLEEICN